MSSILVFKCGPQRFVQGPDSSDDDVADRRGLFVMALSNFEVEGRSGAQVLELPRPDHGIEAERERIKSDLARELHDQVAQTLINLSIQTEVFILAQQGHQQVLDPPRLAHNTSRQP